MNESKRNYGYDMIRIISIFMVVGIHSNVASFAAEKGTLSWFLTLILQSLYLVSVPLFFMISGALLLNKEREITIKDLYTKRIPKQAIPFVIWSIVYIMFRMIMGRLPVNIGNFFSILHTPAYYQFWFMYTLLGIYLILPILQSLVNSLDKKKTEYMLLLILIFSVVVPMISRYVPGFKISDHVDLVLFEGYLGYFLLGNYLKKYHQSVSGKKAIVMYSIGAFITLSGAIIEYLHSVNTNAHYAGYAYQSYMTAGVVISAAGAFLLLGNMKYQFSEKVKAIITKLSGLSIGIYYIHMLVMTAFEYLGFTGADNFILLFVKTITVYFVSLIGGWIISKIPYVRKALLGME